MHMSNFMRALYRLIATVSLLLASWSAHAVTVTLPAAADNTLIEDSTGSLSNGKGDWIYAGIPPRVIVLGQPGFRKRRALVRFDLSSIPAGAQITAATMNLTLKRLQNGTTQVSLHKMTESWGEGTSICDSPCGHGVDSTPNDATWLHRFYPNTLWSTPGGSFEPIASATTVVSNLIDTTYSWSSAQLVADVQGWVGSPATNAGWAVIDETADHAKAYASREYAIESQRPQLTVTYTTGATTGGDGDVPLPAWALVILAACLFGAIAKFRRT